LIVSANWYNEQEPNYILVPITSVIHDPLARHETLIQGAEAKQAGLLYNSVVKVGNPFTIHQQIILRQMGRLSQAMLKRIIERFEDLFAI
jgi:mRNA-degrading endonuclease toxin of MazEF toxin-antitoxin module